MQKKQCFINTSSSYNDEVVDQSSIHSEKRAKRKYEKHNTPGNRGEWSPDEHTKFVETVRKIGLGKWTQVAQIMGTRTSGQCQIHFYKYKTKKNLSDEQFLKEINAPINQYTLPEKRLQKQQKVLQLQEPQNHSQPLNSNTDQYKDMWMYQDQFDTL